MPNIQSSKKALRQSKKKQKHNLFWKNRIRAVAKNLKAMLQTKNASIDILKKEESALQKVVDKAAKNQVIHKNKAGRIKSAYANRISAYLANKTNKETASKSAKSAGKSAASSKTTAA